jgi:hypothetical protein
MPGNYVQSKMISRDGMPGMQRLVMFILALTMLSGYALAHTPSDVALSYNESSADLDVAITHMVDDPSTHYVKRVTVWQGTTVLIDQSYTRQPDKSAFTYRYNLPQLKGSSGEITINVECNLIGSRSATISLAGTPSSGAPGSTVPAPPKTPLCAFAALIASGLVATRIMR